MSQVRQSELFASQDWKVLYRAFTQINFNASDPTTINRALRDYLRTNYPEDFNDWIESSEFVAIIDLLSWLAGTLAFKIDINARENFLETASARESVLRLARFLSYNPSRNRPATGLVKIVEVQTDDDLTDSNGRSLSGQRIQWNNADDPDWYENFVTIMNAAFVSTNPFGTPLKQGNVGLVPAQLYRINTRFGDNSYAFNARASGTSMDFELCNGDFEADEIFTERSPDPNAAFHIFYRNDSNGNASANTGFFVMFKQGSMKRQLFTIGSPVENQLLDVENRGVTEDDVWVQSVSDSGFLQAEWTRVPALFSENITFNSLPAGQRDVYSVITRDDDKVSIRFSDGIFGTAPSGNIAVWHRVANGSQYTIKPFDIERVTQAFNYVNRRGVRRTLRIVFSLVSTVANATPRESEGQVKRRAPAVYSTQSRMVSGEDYNAFPLSSNLAVKLKAVNRIYSGHSRHIDMNDPTSTYQDVNVFSDDGAIYTEPANIYEEVPVTLNRSPMEIVEHHIQPMLKNVDVRGEMLSRQIVRAVDPTHPLYVEPPIGTWNKVTSAKFSSTGWFSSSNANFRVGATILFKTPTGEEMWVAIAEINDKVNSAPPAGYKGPVTLAEPVPTGSTMLAIVPAYASQMPLTIKNQVAQKVDLGLSFSLWYEPLTAKWLVEDYSSINIRSTPPMEHPSAIKVLCVESSGGILWKLSARGSKMIFESMRKIKWYQNSGRVTDSRTGARKIDTVAVLGTNPDLNDEHGRPLKVPSVFNTEKLYYYNNGTHEPRRVQVIFTDDDEDGGFDNPDSYLRLVPKDRPRSTLFWRLGEAFGAVSYLPSHDILVLENGENFEPSRADNNAVGQIAYRHDLDKFYENLGEEWEELNRRDFKVARGRGPNLAMKWITADGSVIIPKADPLFFHWKHYAQVAHRIDPAITNIIDVFVLSSEYDYLTRQWIARGAKLADLPQAPSELDLRLTFRNFEEFKMFSDEIVWRPVSYKFLFGPGSEDQNLRAKFKVVKLANSTVADGEIKSRVIRAINQFFDVTRWDFGETFYFTELAAFVHQQLASVIGSFVVVPQDEDASFGDGFEVTAHPDEIFISTAQVGDVEIISSNTSSNLRIR
jgi:hypothetical protein